jgi:hypothetical protein
VILLTKSSCEVIGKSDAGTSGIAIGKTELRCRTILFLGGGIETRLVDIGISRSEPSPLYRAKPNVNAIGEVYARRLWPSTRCYFRRFAALILSCRYWEK